MLRRPEQMLSSILKFGTTDHIAPGVQQVNGSNGVAAVDWVYGDHIGNIQKLIDLTQKNIDDAGGNGCVDYDSGTGTFRDADGGTVTRGDLHDLATVGLARTAQAGGNTLARYALLRSSVQSLSAGQGRRGTLGGLVQLSRQLRLHVSSVAPGSGALKGIFYRRTGSCLGDALTNAANSINDVRLPAVYLVGGPVQPDRQAELVAQDHRHDG